MKRHPDARKACAHAWQGLVLACLLLLSPVIAQPVGGLPTPADPELADLATRISGQVQLGTDEQPSLRNRWSNFQISGFISREQVLLYGSVVTALFVTLLLLGALVINRRMGREIKARHAIERDLKISESRLRAAMKGAEIGLWEWNPQTGKVYFDSVWFTMLGYDPDTLPHTLETFEALVHPDDLAAAQATIATLSAERQERFDAEFRLRCRDGSYRWIHSKGSLLETDRDGKPFRLIGINTDVTESKLRERALRESEQRFRRLVEQLRVSEIRFRATFEQAAVGIAHVAPDGRFLRINRKFSDIAGYSQDEMMQLAFQDITYPDDLDEDITYVQQLLEGEIENYTMEKRYVRKDAGAVWVSLTGSLIRDAAGQPDWFVAVIQDISERKRAEQAVLDYQQRLKNLSAELAHTEERERRIIATELHDHVGQSLAIMRMQLVVAQRETAGQKVNTILGEVSESLRMAIQDTRNIMSELSSAALNELGLAAAIADFLREKIGAHNGLQTSFNDEGQDKSLNEYTRMVLFRSVRELLMNVVKHAGASHVTVSIQREDNAVKIIVEDDGAGMPATPDADKSATGGFGLFSIEEGMHDLGGSLSIESAPGKGVRAVLIAPRDEE